MSGRASHHARDPLAAVLDVRADVVEDEPREPICVSARVRHRDDAAHRGTDQHEPVEPQSLDERGEVAGLIGVLVRAARRPGALTVATHIGHDQAKAVLEDTGPVR